MAQSVRSRKFWLATAGGALALVVPCAVLFSKEETVPVPAGLERREII